MRVFFDESGFTGEDLANLDQPIFVLASTTAGDAECAAVRDRVFRAVESAELKHSSLGRNAKGQSRVLDLFSAIRDSDHFAVWVVHKEFCLLSKLVDLWLEPAMHARGIDFYQRGANLNFCNMAWFCLRTFESSAFVRNHLVSFQEMMRNRSRKSYKRFWEALARDARRTRSETREIIAYFLYAASHLGFDHLVSLPERSLDICLTSALQSVGHWRRQTSEDLQIVHDNSSNMAREKWIWDAVTSERMSSFRVGPEDFPVEYPLRVSLTTFAYSSDHLQLQFADILAGATAAWGRSLLLGGSKGDYSMALKQAGIGKHLIGGIWPTPDIEPISQAPGSISANHYINLAAHVIHKARRSKPRPRRGR